MRFHHLFIARFVRTMFFPPKTFLLFFLLFSTLILAPPALAEGDSPDLLAAKGNSPNPGEHSDPEARLIFLMNQCRIKVGLRPLKPSRLLGEVARTHSRDMSARNFFSHASPNGWGPKERLERAGYAWRAYGENIGCGQDSPEKILNTWMNSASHRETIIEPAYSEVGVGLIRGGECRIYWTALFASPRGR
jgi:uncharacterized protein YkwD